MAKISLICLAMMTFFMAGAGAKDQSDCGKKYAVIVHDHEMFDRLKEISCWVGPEDRKQIIALSPRFDFKELPSEMQQSLKPFYPNMLKGYIPRISVGEPDPKITELASQVTADSFGLMLDKVLSFGIRRSDAEKKKFTDWAKIQLESQGYSVTTDYNVVAELKGTVNADEFIVVVGHFDTVPSTVGADDNAGGTAGVLELARMFQKMEAKRTIVFLLSNDEEKGLRGAIHYLRQMTEKGMAKNIKFVVNMDMIGYNKNGIVDLETGQAQKSLAEWMAAQTMTYTKLTPKIVLSPWGSDHVPFIEAGISALLTIENWDTHTPCWHKSCDMLNTINKEYAAQLLKLNAAAIAQKAEVRL